MTTAWLIMAVVGGMEIYRLRRGDKRTRLVALTVWILCLGYAGTSVFADWLPLPVWLIRFAFGWAG